MARCLFFRRIIWRFITKCHHTHDSHKYERTKITTWVICTYKWTNLLHTSAGTDRCHRDSLLHWSEYRRCPRGFLLQGREGPCQRTWATRWTSPVTWALRYRGSILWFCRRPEGGLQAKWRGWENINSKIKCT